VDLGIVLRGSEEWGGSAAVHFDVLWGCERVQAPRGVELGVLDGGIPVRLAEQNSVVLEKNRTGYVCTGIRTVETPRRCILVQ